MHLEKERDRDLNGQAVHHGNRGVNCPSRADICSLLDRVGMCGLPVQKRTDVTVCSISESVLFFLECQTIDICKKEHLLARCGY